VVTMVDACAEDFRIVDAVASQAGAGLELAVDRSDSMTNPSLGPLPLAAGGFQSLRSRRP
jgi:hypothetical protein